MIRESGNIVLRVRLLYKLKFYTNLEKEKITRVLRESLHSRWFQFCKRFMLLAECVM